MPMVVTHWGYVQLAEAVARCRAAWARLPLFEQSILTGLARRVTEDDMRSDQHTPV